MPKERFSLPLLLLFGELLLLHGVEVDLLSSSSIKRRVCVRGVKKGFSSSEDGGEL